MSSDDKQDQSSPEDPADSREKMNEHNGKPWPPEDFVDDTQPGRVSILFVERKLPKNRNGTDPEQ